MIHRVLTVLVKVTVLRRVVLPLLMVFVRLLVVVFFGIGLI